jgi:hypothetical protein
MIASGLQLFLLQYTSCNSETFKKLGEEKLKLKITLEIELQTLKYVQTTQPQ